MTIINILLLVVEALTCILLVGVILLQKAKSEGLGLAFGSGMGETLFGSRAGNVLTRITITLAIVFLITTTLLAMTHTSANERSRSIIDSRTADLPMSSAPAAAPAAAPVAPSAQPMVSEPPTAPAAPTLLPGVSLEDQPAAAPQVESTAPAAP